MIVTIKSQQFLSLACDPLAGSTGWSKTKAPKANPSWEFGDVGLGEQTKVKLSCAPLSLILPSFFCHLKADKDSLSSHFTFL